MNIYDSLEGLSRIRPGHILLPEDVQAQGRNFKQSPKLDGYGIALAVPNWLATAMETTGERSARQLSMLTLRDSSDTVLSLVLQGGTSQLRLLLPLSDERVRAYLRDCSRRECLTLYLEVEHTMQVCMLTVPGKFADEELVLRKGRGSMPSPESFVRLVKLANALARVDAAASLVSGLPVTDVVTAIVGHDLAGQLEAVMTIQEGEADSQAAANYPLH